MRTVITYGTFDIFHIGHLRILERLKLLGDKLVVGVSTDEFNQMKGKSSLLSYEDRAAVVSAIKCVDLVIPECTWEQKIQDIKTHDVDIFGMGDDWVGKFDFLKEHCEVVYLPRTFGISSSKIKSITASLSLSHIKQIESSAKEIVKIFETFGFKEE